ncbi:hypothetical protein ANN_01854 [Periplaneta americana]|uniref:Uncharacterized protein n=1 Tax=Periplaneta americana TaxID=6978 RepID=A0ABQ8TUN2_PERAM|nr:hypothetical protein ANN_01854 [Periplaneta americana]
MAGLCEGGNEPSGSLKAICKQALFTIAALTAVVMAEPIPLSSLRNEASLALTGMNGLWYSSKITSSLDCDAPDKAALATNAQNTVAPATDTPIKTTGITEDDGCSYIKPEWETDMPLGKETVMRAKGSMTTAVFVHWLDQFARYKSLMLAGKEFQSLGRAIVKEDEYEEVRWDGIVSIVSWRERVFRLWWEERAKVTEVLRWRYLALLTIAALAAVALSEPWVVPLPLPIQLPNLLNMSSSLPSVPMQIPDLLSIISRTAAPAAQASTTAAPASDDSTTAAPA